MLCMASLRRQLHHAEILERDLGTRCRLCGAVLEQGQQLHVQTEYVGADGTRVVDTAQARVVHQACVDTYRVGSA